MGSYKENRENRVKYVNVMVRMSSDMVKKLDEWGISNGMTSRSSTGKKLIEKALKAEPPHLTKRNEG
jgi:metal-responsive CopG/Arc/MetJ family transcriptional regulator